MPWRPSVSTSSTWPPSAARASARAAATVVLPVPPFPVTTWQRTEEGTGLTDTSVEGRRTSLPPHHERTPSSPPLASSGGTREGPEPRDGAGRGRGAALASRP